MGKSKKGSAFERDTCKQLSLWFSHGERDDIFWRTAGSGARATCRAKQGLMTADSAGDICAIHPSAKCFTRISIWELKRGYSAKNSNRGISLLTIIDKLTAEKPPILVEWWTKLIEELKTHKRKFGFIIFKRDRKNACIAMHTSTFDYLNRRNKKKYYWPPFGPNATIYTNGLELRIMQLEDFLEWCEPETLTRKTIRRQKGEPYEQKESQGSQGRRLKRRSKAKEIPKRRKIKRRG
jgi:hypothetical protein